MPSLKIVVAIIGAIGLIVAAIIGIIPDLISPAKTNINIKIDSDDIGSNESSKDLPFIYISHPKNGAEVLRYFEINGTISEKIPDGYYMWALTNPKSKPKEYYPQNSSIMTENYTNWSHEISLNGNDRERFNVVVAFVDETTNNKYEEYMDNGPISGWKPQKLPATAKSSNTIQVILRNSKVTVQNTTYA